MEKWNYEKESSSPLDFFTNQVEAVQHHKHLFHLSAHHLTVVEVEQNLEEREPE